MEQNFKITKKEGTNCFLIKVYSSNEYYTDTNWLYLKLEPKDIVYLKSLDNILKQTKETIKNLYQLVLWNSCKIWWINEESFTEEMIDAFEKFSDECSELEDIESIPEFESKDSESYYTYTECDMMKIDEWGLSFYCQLKNSETSLEALTLPITELK